MKGASILPIILIILASSLLSCRLEPTQTPSPELPSTPGSEPVTSAPTEMQREPSPEDVEWLAKVIASEAGSVYDKGSWVKCTDGERSAVCWTVLNRVKSGTYGESIEEVVTAPGQYAHNQDPTPEIIELATRLLKGQIADVSGGATHFFSPISMPKEGEPTAGFDVREGIHHLYQVPRIDKNVYFPSWTTDHVWVGDLNDVRSAYFMFYRPVTPAPKAAHILYVVDEICPYYTEEWPFHLKARGFQIETMTVTSALLDANLEDYGLIVVGYVLNSRVSMPVYISIANSGLPILNGSQWLVQLFGQGTNAFDGRTSYGESIHITSDHPLTKGYSGEVICSQYPMYRNMIEADGTVLAKVTTTEKDRPPAPPGGPAPTPVSDVTGDVWSVKGNRIYFGFWPSGQDNVHYWAFFDRSVDYLLAEVSVATPAPTPVPSPTLDLSMDEIYEKLFHSNLIYHQQEELWGNYRGKQVEWIGTLREKTIREDRLEALFTPYVVVKLEKEERQTLSQLDIGNSVTYRGNVESYGTNIVTILLDYGLSIPLISEMQEDFNRGLTWAETLKNHGFSLSEIMERSDIEFQEIIILKDGVIISYE